jgi:hypothetical protein
MVYYILFIICATVLLTYGYFYPNKNKIVLWSVFLLAVCFAGFREFIGADFVFYVDWYLNKTRDTKLEFGFVAVMNLFRYFHLGYNWLFFFFSFFTCFFVFLGIKKFTVNVNLAFLIFLLIPGLYLNSFSVIRQYFSLAISFYAFYYLINKKYIIYLLLMFVGISMHNTCYIPFFVFLGVYKWGSKIKVIHIALTLAVSLVFSQIHFLELLGSFFEKTRYIYYFSTHRHPTNNLKLVVLNIVAVVVLFHFENMKKKYPLQQYLMPLYFFSIIFTNLFAIYIDLTRIAYYFKIFEIIVIADLIFLGTKEKSYKYLTFFYIYYLSVYIFALWTDLNDKCQFANYKNILF